MTYKPKEGDYVRVVLEGSVYVTVCGAYLDFDDNPDTDAICLDDKSIKSIEKIEEPLMPGDLCWCWDEKKDNGSMCIFLKFNELLGDEFPYKTKNNAWEHAEKVPEPLATQLKELYFND